MAIQVKTRFDGARIMAQIDRAWDLGLALLTEEIKNDSNQYIKADQWTLRNSSDIHSIPREGKIIWQTAYARRQYWAIETANKFPNPNASWKWFHVAKSKHLKDWVKQAERLVKMGL